METFSTVDHTLLLITWKVWELEVQNYVGSTLKRMTMTFKKLVTKFLGAWCVLLTAIGSNCYTEQTGSAYFCCTASYPPKYWGRRFTKVEGSLSAIFNSLQIRYIYQIYLNLYSKLGRIYRDTLAKIWLVHMDSFKFIDFKDMEMMYGEMRAASCLLNSWHFRMIKSTRLGLGNG